MAHPGMAVASYRRLNVRQNKMNPQMRYPDGDDTPTRLEVRNLRKMAREEIYRKLLKVSDEIAALLFQDDPLGRNIGPNDPEYDKEAQAILRQLFRCRAEADVLVLVHRVFSEKFGDEKGGPEARYSTVASEIWRLWRNRL